VRRFLIIALLAGTVACGGSSSSSKDSGIEGTVKVGPQCPVEIVGSPCPDAPAAVPLVIHRRGEGAAVTTIRSAMDGTFRVALAPGDYTIEPASPSAFPRGGPVDVTVRAHAYTHVDVLLDSGIR
jgi:hypothetical protein